MASNLESELIRGGITPLAAKAITNAIANSNNQDNKTQTQFVDNTQTSDLRMVTGEARRTLFENIDTPSNELFEKRLKKKGFEKPTRKSDYDSSEPRATTERVNTPSVTGGDHIKVNRKRVQDINVNEISFDIHGQGRHPRVSSRSDMMDAVDFVFENDLKGYMENSVVELPSKTVLKSAFKGLSKKEVVTSTGQAIPLTGWFDNLASVVSVFTQWAKTNVLQASDVDEFFDNVIEIETWTPRWQVINRLNSLPALTLPDSIYTSTDTAGNAGCNKGIYTKIGDWINAKWAINHRINKNPDYDYFSTNTSHQPDQSAFNGYQFDASSTFIDLATTPFGGSELRITGFPFNPPAPTATSELANSYPFLYTGLINYTNGIHPFQFAGGMYPHGTDSGQISNFNFYTYMQGASIVPSFRWGFMQLTNGWTAGGGGNYKNIRYLQSQMKSYSLVVGPGQDAGVSGNNNGTNRYMSPHNIAGEFNCSMSTVGIS